MNSTARFRPNVGIMVINTERKILAGEAFHYPDDWMMPQGGIDSTETPYDAMRRELLEETGLQPDDLEFIDEHDEWLEYLFPKPQYKDDIFYVGQRQKWFLLRCDGPPPAASQASEQEFSRFDWVDLQWLLEHTRPFRRTLYREVFAAFQQYFKI